MIKKLRLKGFKNFKDTELILGSFTTLVGTNASGKSNLREAFRFLHGIARGYTLAEIIGEKWGEGGYLQWRGISGGLGEICYLGANEFFLEVELDIFDDTNHIITMNYGLIILATAFYSGVNLKITREYLYKNSKMLFDTHPKENPPIQHHDQMLKVRVNLNESQELEFTEEFPNNISILYQLTGEVGQFGRRWEYLAHKKHGISVGVSYSELGILSMVISELKRMQFLDLYPEAMRQPSFQGQKVLGDKGENLSSVLKNIYEDEQKRKALIEWVRELTPMDVNDFSFVSDLTGKTLARINEANGHSTSLYSASDGTLRFLGLIAAMFSSDYSHFYFIEELENGIHPTRLNLLVQLIESVVNKPNPNSDNKIQVIATTHSPQLLRFLSPTALEYASVIYRLPESPEGRIKRILDIPEARRVLEQQDIARLYESGWLEDAVAFLDEAVVV